MTESEHLSSGSSDPDHSTEWTSGVDDVDLAASARLDGEPTADEPRQLDPAEVEARVVAFAQVAEHLRLPVAELPEQEVNRLITTALAARDETAAVAASEQPVVGPVWGPHTRARAHRWRWERIVGAAAAVVLVGGLLAMAAAILGRGSGTSTVASSARSTGPEAASAGARDQSGTSTKAATGRADLQPGSGSPAPVEARSGVASALGGSATPTQDLPSLGVFADQDALLASLAASMSIPQLSGQAPSTTAAAANPPSAAPSPASGASQNAQTPSCSLQSGIRVLGTALVGGRALLVARDDASGHILAFDATTCSQVFDRMP